MGKSNSTKDIVKFLEYLHPGNKTFEVCAIGSRGEKSKLRGNKPVKRGGIVAGWFNDPKVAAKRALQLDELNAEGVYVTLNPCHKSLRERTHGELKANVNRTTDEDIRKLTNILIDIDPKRKSGTSSTEKQRKAAIQKAKKVRKWLTKQGYPDPLVISSGNGAHLIYKTDMENTGGNVQLIREFLKGLATKYNDDQVTIDEAVYNPSRLTKLPGTFTRKGEDLHDRPHRRAKILEMPKKIERVPQKRLQKITSAMTPVKKEKEHPPVASSSMDVKTYLKHYDVRIAKTKSPYRGGKLYVLEKCVFNGEHKPAKASIFQSSEGKLYFRCLHNSCKDKRWADARRKISGNEKLKRFFNGSKKRYAGDRERYSIMSGGQLIEQRIKETPIIKGLLESTGSLLIVGPTGIMKSMMTLNIALNLAAPPDGGRLWNLFDIPKARKTLFIQSENSIYGMQKRIRLMIHGNEEYDDASGRIFFPTIRDDCRITGDLRSKTFQKKLKEMIFETKARLLVIDPLISFHTQSENENAEMRKVLDQLTHLCDVTKTASIVVHHTGKTPQDGTLAGRGASSIADWAGNILVLSDENADGEDCQKRIKVTHRKSRNFETVAPFLLDVSGTLQFTKVVEPTEAKQNNVVKALKVLEGKECDQKTLKAALVKQGVGSGSTAGRAIKDAVKAGKIQEDRDGNKAIYSLVTHGSEEK